MFFDIIFAAAFVLRGVSGAAFATGFFATFSRTNRAFFGFLTAATTGSTMCSLTTWAA